MKCSCGFVNQVVSSTLSPTPEPATGASNLVGVDPCTDYRHHFGSAPAHQPYCAQIHNRHFHEARDQQQQQQQHFGMTCPSDPGHRQMSDLLWESQLATPEGLSQTARAAAAASRDSPPAAGGVFTILAVPEVNSALGAAAAAGGVEPNTTAFVSFVPLSGDRSPYAGASTTGFVVRQQARSCGVGVGGGVGGGEDGGVVGERKPKDEMRINGSGELKAVISDYGRRCAGYCSSTPDKCSHKKQQLTSKHHHQQQQQQFHL